MKEFLLSLIFVVACVGFPMLALIAINWWAGRGDG